MRERLEEFSEAHTERSQNRRQRLDGDPALAAFNTADIRPMDARLICKLLLRHDAGARAERAEASPELLS